MPRQGQMVPGTNALDYEVVYYEGTDTLKTGYTLFYNFDYGTAATATKDRYSRVEKASSTNIHHFAGVVAEGLPSAGKAGPGLFRLVKPTNVSCTGFSDQACTLGYTLLYVQSGSYYLTDAVYTSSTANSRPVAVALQTIDRSSTAGTVQVLLDDHIAPFAGLGATANNLIVASSGVTSGTLVAASLSMECATAGGTFNLLSIRGELTGAAGTFGTASTGGGVLKVQGILNGTTMASSSAMSAHLIWKTGATATAGIFAAAEFKHENQDSTPAALSGLTVVNIYSALQMNEDPGSIYHFYFSDEGTTNATAWFKAKTAAAVAFVTATNTTIDHAITIDVAGTTYYIGCYDAQTGS